MKVLKDLLYRVRIERVIGSTEIEINEVCFDSRSVNQQDLFVAIRGTVADGHDYIPLAIKAGATAIVVEQMPEKIQDGLTYVQVDDSQEAMAYIASNFYDDPTRDIKLIGVTGTNGKTTTTTLMFDLFTALGYSCGLISTVHIRIGKQTMGTKNTTPDALTINKHLAEMREAGVAYCFMEVSSHGVVQHRATALRFDMAVFTNLSHDHLDYHKTFANYRDAKKMFFDNLPATAVALTNKDDRNGNYMLQNTSATKRTYALKNHADYHARVIENQFSGLLLELDGHELWSKLVGQFNAYNLLAVYACAKEMGFRESEILEKISLLEGVSGRFQHFTTERKHITAIVDYAHTPDALENVLETINSIRTKNETLITVVGCGGDRDASKRPEMASIAGRLSDKVILTSDNPRTEDPDAIIRDMEKGIQPMDVKKVLSITSRAQAIRTAAQLAEQKDIILIAGKGHETYQEINGERKHFDDREQVITALKELEK